MEAVRVFFCYMQEEEKLRNEQKRYLGVMKRYNGFAALIIGGPFATIALDKGKKKLYNPSRGIYVNYEKLVP